MGRRYTGSNNRLLLVGILIGGYFVITIIIAVLKFIEDNKNSIITALIGGAVGFVSFVSVKYIIYRKKVREYKITEYFKFTNIPYSEVKTDIGKQFEAEVFNKLKKLYSKNTKFMVNVLIPRVGSINEFAEIDLLLFHESGIYCLELKNYSGYVYGDMNSKKWNVGYKNVNKKTKTTSRKVFEFQNPIFQNNKHIEDLKKIFNHDYQNFVIFSTNTKIDSNIDNVMYLDKFIKKIDSITRRYSSLELKEPYDAILDRNVSHKANEHIERIKFNEKKYSKK